MRLLQESLISPKTLARHRLLSIGVVMRYIFSWIAIITAASFAHFAFGFTENNALQSIKDMMTASGMQWIVYPFAALFLFVSNTLLIMSHISLLSAVTMFIMRPFPFRIQYRQIWRTTALAMTIHYIAYSIAPFIQDASSIVYIGAFIITLGYSLRAAMHFPPARRNTAK
ncbi:DUF1189 family protein [Caryophanon latum]|uniref:Uncharacterized protein n=1 Tax=Caryophanon latum TaxID=33977 RepID=A0A1C0YU07_9BACL|nr:DUF1189 family protein [Caryophanon latum]OCS90639.1 hypothetical protein A6K76_10855 [Caryophanon latum]